MKTTQISDIREVFEIATRFQAVIGEEDTFAFRGHSNTAYRLEPTLARALRSRGISEIQAIEIEKNLTFEYRRRSKPMRPKSNDSFFSSDGTDLHLWQTMQHYGAPTRLLDWTRSFYVALYFAVVASHDVAGAVVVINLSALHQWYGMKEQVNGAKDFEKHLNGPPRQIVYKANADFERAVIQQGLFTMPTHLMCDHDRVFEEAHLNSQHEMEKIEISKQCKPKLLSQLISMNLTAATLFPGLDGVARSIRELALICGTSCEYADSPAAD